MTFGLIAGLSFVLIGWLSSGFYTGSIVGLILGLLLWLTFGPLFFLIQGESIDLKTQPNQGIKRSATNALVIGLVSGLYFGLPVTFLFGSSAGLFMGLYGGLIGGLVGGGTACMHHFTLRLILYQNNYIPWNYARFLDYARDLQFIQQIGGRYRFMHDSLRDHFANMESRE
jgi:hypothetical protein